MPYRRRYSRLPYRRRYRRRSNRFRRYRRWRRRYRKFPIALPRTYRRKLIYNENWPTTALVAETKYEYRANSVYDPRVALGGHQPRDFDQITALAYNEYRVYSGSMQIKMSNASGHSTSIAIGVVHATDAGIDYEALREMPGSRCVQLTEDDTKNMTVKFNYKRQSGKSPRDKDNLSSVTNNPADVYYYVIIVKPSDNADTIDVNFDFRIVYNVEFVTRHQPGQS